jgi:hypothetical protein
MSTPGTAAISAMFLMQDAVSTCKATIPFLLKLHQGFGRRRFEKRFRAFAREFGSIRMIDWLTPRPCLDGISISSFMKA